MQLTSKVIGEREIVLTLKGMKSSKINRMLRLALTYATTPLVQAVKTTAPKESGLLRKSIGRKIKTYAEKSTVATVGPRYGFRKWVLIKKVIFGGKHPHASRLKTIGMYRSPTRYAHFNKGWMAAAGKQAMPEVQRRFGERMGRELAKAIKK
jgi:hypothetical protein